MTAEAKAIRPNPGPQEAFLSSPADIAIYGGAAGAGKTWALLVEPLRWVHLPNFRAVFFRRTFPQITEAGGPWDQAAELYPPTGARSRYMEWIWPSGARVEFHHLQLESDVHSYDGAQIALELWDELSHFTERQFWYLQSRLRTLAPVKPYLRATTNPTDPEHWLYRLIRWWIADDGFPDPSRAGKIRWFVRHGDELLWADTPEELERYGKPLSLAFYPARLEHNPRLLERDPDYLHRLQNLPRVERERLLLGNWHVRPVSGQYFRREWIRYGPPPPRETLRIYQGVDLAISSRQEADATAIVTVGRDHEGRVWVLDAVTLRGPFHQVLEAIKSAAAKWGPTRIAIEAVQYQAAVVQELMRTTSLPVFPVRPDKDKVTRALPLSARYEQGFVWHSPNLPMELEAQLVAFPHGTHDDLVDALVYAFMAEAMAVGLSPEDQRRFAAI